MGMRSFLDLPPAEARLLPEGRMAGPMPWVIAVMIFLTVLAAAVGLSLSRSVQMLDQELAGRVTIQLLEANSVRRLKQAEAIEQRLANLEGVQAFRRVSDREMARLLAPWFGPSGIEAELPVPTLIDVTLDPAQKGALGAMTVAVEDIAPSARIEQHAKWLAPLVALMQSLTWLAGLLVTLIASATTAVVVLAARSALNTHGATIDVMHLLGATDGQIARLFQRRIGLDALFGAGLGLIAALVTMALLHGRIDAVGSELLGSVGLGWGGWLGLMTVPILTSLVATLAARATILLALRRLL